MQLRIIAVGKVQEAYMAAACSDFAKRLRPYYPVEILEVKHSPHADLIEEARRIVRLLHEDDRVWLLDRTGTQLDSEGVSAMLQETARSGVRRLTLIVGGTHGVHESVTARANFRWSLSPLTFWHEWARAIVLEQIYRAAKIARNEPYHH